MKSMTGIGVKTGWGLALALALGFAGAMRAGAAPSVTEVKAYDEYSPDGTYGVGDEIYLMVGFNQDITYYEKNPTGDANSKPAQLRLQTYNGERYADCEGIGLDGNIPVLVFKYVVKPGDFTGDLDCFGFNALQRNGDLIEGLADGTFTAPAFTVPRGAAVTSLQSLSDIAIRTFAFQVPPETSVAEGSTIDWVITRGGTAADAEGLPEFKIVVTPATPVPSAASPELTYSPYPFSIPANQASARLTFSGLKAGGPYTFTLHPEGYKEGLAPFSDGDLTNSIVVTAGPAATFSIIPPPAAINEGDSATCSIILSRAAQADFTVLLTNSNPSKVQLGSAVVSFAAGDSVKTFQMQALDGPATVTIGGTASQTYTLDTNTPAVVSTLNVAPVLNTPADPWVLPAGTVNVPVAFTWSGTDVAADMAAPLYANVDFGDGTVVSNDNGSVSHSYSAPGVYAIALTLHDKDGGTAARNTAVTIRNTTFSITAPAAAINEGDPFLYDCSVILSTPAQSSVTVTLANSDPSKLEIIGSGMVSFSAGESVKTFQVRALDGPGTVTIGGSASHTYSLDSPALVSTLNVAPVLNNPPDPWVLPPGAEGLPVSFSWTGSDVPADMAAPLSVVISFGDGTGSGTISGNSGTFNHTYNTPGTYGVTITLSDKDGGVSARVSTIEILPAFQVLVTEIVNGLPPSYKGLPGLGAGMIDDVENLTVRTPVPGTANSWLYKYSPTAAATTFVATPTNVMIDVDGALVAYDSFFHVWQGDGFMSALAVIPIANRTAMLQLAEQGNNTAQGRDISGVFSREYFPEDNYADIDQDQLPDLWEDLHWPGTLAFETPNRMGNPDGDFLPRGANPNMAYPAAGNNYAPDGTAFGNVFEVRGLDPALNALGSELPPPPPDDWPLDEPHYENDTRVFYGTDPTVDDTDNDGLTDGWEYYFWMNATNRGIVGESYDPQAIITGNPIDSATIAADFHPLIAGDAGTDTDGDGLSNLEEMVIGTNPVHWDTDGDYMCDGWEVMRGLDPITRDGGGNPDGDYMAALGWRPTTPRTGDPVAPLLDSIHFNVYQANGYDPRTGWGASYIERDRATGYPQYDTTAMLNVDEYAIMRFWIDYGSIGAVEPDDWGDYSTNPFSCDTDGDGAPDGWEAYVFFNPSYGEDGTPAWDVDRDGLALAQEFCGQETSAAAGVVVPMRPVNIGTNNIQIVVLVTNGAPTQLANVNDRWWNKFWPVDPNNGDTDGDSLSDGVERGTAAQFTDPFQYDPVALGYSTEYIRGSRAGGGLNPTCVDTDMDFIPDFWEVQYRKGHIVSIDLATGATTGVPGMDGTIFDSKSTVTELTGRFEDYDYDGDGLSNYQEYWANAIWHFNYDKWNAGQGPGGYDPAALFTGQPHHWDWAIAANFWQPAVAEGSRPPFHIPFRFIQPEPRPMILLYASTDPSLWDSDGDGMDDHYEMFHGLNPLWSETADIISKGAPARVPDIRMQPWTAGEGLADPDQDGLRNWEEALFPGRPDPANYHTDPSPLWVTDRSYPESWVNLYYWPGSNPWYWPTNALGSPVDPYPAIIPFSGAPPSYVFSFESDEGYDTDNDNIPDKQELVGTDQPGATDPLHFDDPRLRKALYLDGQSAARTQFGSSHSLNQLRSWTVEIWVRPEAPVSSQRQIIIERPVKLNSSDPMPNPDLVRRTFRIGLEPGGYPFAEYNDSGNDLLTETVDAPGAMLQPGHWYHLAATMDGKNSRLTLYVNGIKASEKPTALIPCTGIIDAFEPLVIPAPIVIGAADSNPGGAVYAGRPRPGLHNHFKGWVDEVRVWDGARAWSDLTADFTARRRYGIDEVQASMLSHASAISDALRQQPANLQYVVITNDLPPVVLYHYTFDNLPDPAHDTIVPRSFDLLNGRPADGSYPGIPWWWQAEDRSRVYSDYLFVHWAENTAAHIPAVPVTDPFGNILRYTFGIAHDSPFWTANAPADTNETDTLYTFNNRTRPSSDTYLTGDTSLTETFWQPSDLLPLWFARADKSVPMWDNDTPGSSPYDSDGDSLPDDWEVAYGFDPLDPNSIDPSLSDGDADVDEDGLSNYWEYRLGSDPTGAYSIDPTGKMMDGQWDSDGDGLSNWEELNVYLTDPTLVDTDNDGIPDKAELDMGLDPLDSISPFVMRYLHNPNGEGYVTIPGRIDVKDETGTRHSLDLWTIEATVRLTAEPQDDIILLSRPVQPLGYVNYELGITRDRLPYVRFQNVNGAEYRVVGYRPIPTNEWTHLSGRYGSDVRGGTVRQLTLFQDTTPVVRDVTSVVPVTGAAAGDMIMARNLIGDLDEVRIWNYDRADEEIADAYGRKLLFGSAVASMGSLRPSGADGMQAGLFQVADRPALRLQEWTVECWFRTANPGNILRRTGGGYDNFSIQVETDGRLSAHMDFLTWWDPPGPAPAYPVWVRLPLYSRSSVVNDEWTHVSFVFDRESPNFTADSVKLFVNGVEEATSPLPPFNWDSVIWIDPQYGDPRPDLFVRVEQLADGIGPLIMGQSQTDESFPGLIDEVCVYNGPSTQVEIRGRKDAKIAMSPGLVSYFDFDGIDPRTPAFVFDKADPNAVGELLSGADVSLAGGDNAPIRFRAIDILRPKLAAYFPLDDGRSAADNGVRCVEDFKTPLYVDYNNEDYAGTLRASPAEIDFVSYFGFTVADYSAPMAFPTNMSPAHPDSPFRSFPLPEGSPWQTDSDGDGMPDIFEQYYSLDADRAVVPERPELEAFGDLDGDGLYNLFEYYAGTDPTVWDSLGLGVADADYDSDGDGIANGDEQALQTHPGRLDTNDDGIADGDHHGLAGVPEYLRWTSPTDAMSSLDRYDLQNPDARFRYKSMVLDGLAHEIPRPIFDRRRFNTPQWTIEAWVFVTNDNATGSLIQYVGEAWTNGAALPITYYELGLSQGLPYVTFQGAAPNTRFEVRGQTSVVGAWTHLAGVWNPEARSLSLYRDGAMVGALIVLDSALSGSLTAERFPGRAYIGSAGVLGNIDEVRIWNVARSAQEILTGTMQLVQAGEPGQIATFRFDDGGEHAEDFAHRLTPSDLETMNLYALRGVTFDADRAITRYAGQFDDADMDGLPDWWEDLYFRDEVTYWVPVPSTVTVPIRSSGVKVLVRGSEEAAYGARLLGWDVGFTPIRSAPDHRWTEAPDAAWMFRDFHLDGSLEAVEMRLAVKPGQTRVFINGTQLDLADARIDPNVVWDPTLPVYTDEIGYFVPATVLSEFVVRGRNRIAVEITNQGAGEDQLEEYFSLELWVNGNTYLIRRGDDPAIQDRLEARWWLYANPGSMIVPPVDPSGRVWSDKDYGLDQDADPDGDGLSTAYESLLGTNPLAPDTDGDGTLDGDEDTDGDGLSNADEQRLGTYPWASDTDDDGFSDGDEINTTIACGGRLVTSPLDSRSPLIPRSMVLDGGETVVPGVVGGAADRFDLSSWTIECRVKPATAAETGTLLARTTTGGRVTFALRLQNNEPVLEFTTTTGVRYFAGAAGNPLPAGEWSRLTGVWDPAADTLALFVDGVSYMAQASGEACATGSGVTVIGGGVQGWIDEIKVHAQALPIPRPGTPPPFTVAAAAGAPVLWDAFLGEPVPPGVSNLVVTFSGAADAGGTYANFPALPHGMPTPGNGIILASGRVQDAPARNLSPGTSTDFGLPGDPDLETLVGTPTYDAAALTIDFAIDDTVDGVSFNLLFASEEFPEFVGSFNDAFAAFLNGTNISFDVTGQPLSVNNNFFEIDNDPWSPGDPAKEGKLPVALPLEYDGLTPLLVTSKTLPPGQYTLKLVVADALDAIYDSAIFLSNFRFRAAAAEGTGKAQGEELLAAFYRFDDGGLTAEDFTHTLDWAYALRDVTMTDAAFATVAGDGDTNDNAIPDWWEQMWFGSLADAGADPDGDGLTNLLEYWSDTNPLDSDSDNNGILDGNEDRDGDGLVNRFELANGTLAHVADTDDDGLTDGEEDARGSDPADSTSPGAQRVLALDGSGYLAVPLGSTPTRLALASYTVEAWVRLNTGAGAGTVIRRQVGIGQQNLWMGVEAAVGGWYRPYARVTPATDTTHTGANDKIARVAAGQGLEPEVWYHLAATFDEASGLLLLYVNGVRQADAVLSGGAMTHGVGPQFTRVGEAWSGYIDEVRVWDGARTADTIRQGMFSRADMTLPGWAVTPTIEDVEAYRQAVAAGGDAGALAPVLSGLPFGGLALYYRFDDGGETAEDFTVAEDWLEDWPNAGVLQGGAAMTGTFPGFVPLFGYDEDRNGDSIPDAWQRLHWPAFDPALPGDWSAEADPDGDGLSNLNEYLAGTHPLRRDSDDDGVWDDEEDSDGDGLSNGDEQAWGSDPGKADSDNDGRSDQSELTEGPWSPWSSPLFSMGSFDCVGRSLDLGLVPAGGIEMPQVAADAAIPLQDWTVETWVRTADAAQSGVLVRKLAGLGEAFALGLEGGIPFARYQTARGLTVRLAAPAAAQLPVGEWTHLAAAWNATEQELVLAVNALAVFRLSPANHPAYTADDIPVADFGPLMIGYAAGGWAAGTLVDNVRVWNTALTPFEIGEGADRLISAGTDARVIRDYRFDDGGPLAEDFAHPGDWRYAITAADYGVGLDAEGHALWLSATAQVFPGIDDSNANGLPDWWESLHGVGDANGDEDGDGLVNLYEFWGRTNPNEAETYGDGIDDGDRADGFGLTLGENQRFGTDPRVADTDGDGLNDLLEIKGAPADQWPEYRWPVSDPRIPLQNTVTVPAPQGRAQVAMRSAAFDGAGRVLLPPLAKYAMPGWTLGAWVNPAAVNGRHVVIRRAVAALAGAEALNYELGVQALGGAAMPYVRYVQTNGIERLIGGAAQADASGDIAIPLDAWTHLAGTFDDVTGVMRLYVNGMPVGSNRVDMARDYPPVTGPVAVGIETTIGGGADVGGVQNGFIGNIDEVTFAYGAATPATVFARYRAADSELRGAFTAAAAAQPLREIAQGSVAKALELPRGEGRLLVRFKPGVSATAVQQIHEQMGARLARAYTLVPLQQVEVEEARITEVLTAYRAREEVLYAEPDYVVTASELVPNDPDFDLLWGMRNTGQFGGLPGADIRAPEAWERGVGTRNVTVAVIDTGVDTTHPDLVDNLWVNPGEIPENGVDDDGNGYVDDVNGYDFFGGQGSPMDDNGHGTHVAGTIGAVGNNAIGVAGVNWNVRIMALKFLGASGSGYTVDAIAAVEYAVRMGAQISNNSWGGGGYSQALYDMIEAARLAGHLFVAGAGNSAGDNDGAFPFYPASYDLDNIISVAASTDLDQLASFSNYGVKSVDLAAPGQNIYSTLPGGLYGFYSGTSMACPHVAGAAALVLSRRPGLSFMGIRDAILNAADKVIVLEGRVATGGRLNLAAAVMGGGIGAYTAYFRFEDDGGRALDYTANDDLLLNWRHAGTFQGSGTDDATYYPLPGDVDGNRMPDWFEAAYAVSDPLDDPDDDGLNNLYECLSGNNPWLDNSDNLGAGDAFEPAAGGFSNLDAQKMGSHPGLADTDDDGLADADEYAGFSNLTLSLHPYTDRVLALDGAADPVALPNQPRFALGDSWTVEGWVKVSTNQTGAFQVIRRTVGAAGVNYELGVTADLRPYVAFSDGDGNRQVAASPVPIAAGRWFHLAGVWDFQTRELHIVLDGRLRQTLVVANVRPAAGEAAVSRGVIGDGLAGAIDDVTVWTVARTPDEICAGMRAHLTGGEAGLVAYYRFDDATSGTAGSGVSGRADWDAGHIEDFALAYRRDWLTEWHHAATVVAVGAVSFPARDGLSIRERDSDDDGLPDWWELAFFGNLAATDGSGDADGDGLSDFSEYRAGTDPTRTHTFGGITSDADIDSDGDGITNAEEQDDYGTHPGEADTDDDGVDDGTEILYTTSPVHPMSVFSTDASLMNMAARRSLDMGEPGMPDVGIELPAFEVRTSVDDFGVETRFETNRFAFGGGGWTVEAWINPQGDLDGEIYTYEPITGNGIRFGLTNGSPYGAILKSDGSPLVDVGGVLRADTNGTLVGASPLPAGRWTHLALTWSPEDNSFSLLQDGVLHFARTSDARPVIGDGRAFIGQGFSGGYLDEVRVWSIVRRRNEIEDWYQKLYPAPGYVAPAPDGAVPAHVGPYRSDYTNIRNDIDELPLWRETYLYGQPLAAYYRFDDDGERIEDFAKLNDDRYALNGPVTTDEAAPLSGWDDADGDGLPEWWIAMYNLDEWPVQHLGPYHVLNPGEGSDYPVTYTQGWATPVGTDGLSRGLYYNTDWVNDEYGVMITTFNVWRDVNPDIDPTSTTNNPPDGLVGNYRGRGEYNEAWDVQVYADYGVWFTDDGTLGFTGMWFNDFDDDGMYSAGEDIWLERWNPDAAQNPQFNLQEIVGVNYFRTFIAYGSVGDHAGWTLIDPGNTNNAPEINWYSDTKSTSVGADGLFSCFTKYVYISQEPQTAELELSLFGVLDSSLYINGNAYDPATDPDRSVLVSLLKRGRNQIYLYTENATAFILNEIDYHYTRDYAREITEMKFDLALTVNDVDLIVRGDTSVVDPRAVWHGQAWSRYYEERPYVKPLPDLSGRHVFHQDFGIANDAESDQTGLVTGDGLDNYTEILIGTNPRDYDSNNNGLSDVDEDFDGDGLSNGDEQGYGSHPAYPDTDDDGVPDGDDSAPASSLAPPVDRVLVLTGGYVEMPNQSRFALADWTIQAWVKPAAAGAGGTVICREVAPGVANYCLGLVAGVPVVRFTPFDRTADIAAAASAALAADEWTHLAASFDGVSGRLSIFVNGDCVATTLTVKHPAASGSGPVRIRVGEGFAGLIDEVAIFGRELNEGDIMQLMHGVGYSATRYAGLVSYYRFDDGTSATGPDDQDRHTGTSGMETWWMGQVEEFAPGYGCDWLADWSNGGTLVGAVAMVEADSPVSFTSGESYTDYDYTEDWWETLFGLTVASPSHYDSHLDPDGDGWDNWSEARYAAVTNDVTASLPDAAESTPIPQVRFTFGYTGALKNGPLVVMAYSRQSMDGEPDATFVLAPLTVDLTTVSATVPSSGRLRQGRNWFFAFIDLDGSGTWNEGEPAGLSERFPYDVGWDRNTVAFTLTDKPVNGFVRFSWPADPAKLSYVVSIRRMTYGPNYTTNYTTIFAKAIGAPRNWIHEGDILDGAGTYGGGNPGLDWGGVIDGATPIPIGSTSTYDLRVDNVTVVPFFQIHYIAEGSQLPMPTVDSPYGGAVQTRPRTEFQWRMSTYASAFELQIAPTNSLAPIYSSGIIAAPPPRDFGNDGTGLRVWSPPVHWGDILPGGALTGPMYRWRVRALQPRDPNGAFGPSPSTFTDFAYLRVDLGGNSTDLGSIEVPLTALYLPAGALIRVQAFETASFNDVPVAQKTLRNVSVLPQTVTLEGLAVNAPHYIAAYIDQSGNNAREVWESWGYHRSATAFPRWHYQPMDVMPGRAPQMPSATLTILHVDSDQDRIPDAYEYAMSGGLAGVPDVPTWLETLGLVPDGALSGSRWTDLDGDGLDDLQEYQAGTDARLTDTDGDGITDSQEVATGLSATRADELRVTGLGADPAAVSWAWTTPEGAPDKRVGVYATQEAVVSPPARLNTAVRYVLERTDSLSAPQWVVVAEATTDLTSGAFDIGADMTARPAGFYRVRAILP